VHIIEKLLLKAGTTKKSEFSNNNNPMLCLEQKSNYGILLHLKMLANPDLFE